MPDKIYDVAIIGAGIIGCSIAWELTSRGAKVVLFEERANPFHGSSMAGFGSLTPYSDPFFSGEAREFAATSVDLYRNKWIPEISARAGQSVPFTDLGLIELFTTDEELERAEAHATDLNSKSNKEIARMLSVAEAREMEPNLSGEFLGALWVDEPWLDKDVYFEALEDVVQDNANIEVQLNTKIVSISVSSSKVSLATNERVSVQANSVISCTGLHPHEIKGVPHIPLKWIRGDAIGVYTVDNTPLLKRHIYMGRGFITPRCNGYMLLGATYEEEAGCPPEFIRGNRDRISLAQFKVLIDSNEKILPALSTCDVSHVWRGWRPTPSDNMPVLGVLAGQPRVVIATGFIGLGITMAPATAKYVTDYCLEGEEKFPQAFSPNRFF